MPTITEVERICREIVRAGDGIFGWQWDGRFQAALSPFTVENEAQVMRILQGDLRSIWRADTVDDGPARVRELARSMGGLMAGQILMCTDEDDELLLFCAWWPWQDGNTISIRLGVLSAEPGAHEDAMKSWFGL